MQIGILQTGHAPEPVRAHAGDYEDMFARLLAPEGLETRCWNVVDGVFPDSPCAADGWLITGSRHGVYEDHPWIPPLEDFLRAALDAGRPVVGICFGHQIMAQALGGRVVKHPEGWRVGPTDYRIEGFDAPLCLSAWHQDQVVEVPPGARVTGSAPGCAVAALAYGDLGLSFQGHPEFDRAVLASLIAARGGNVTPSARLEEARARIDMPLDNAAVARAIALHFRSAHDRKKAPDAQRRYLA